jgi:hypothetical protein
MNLAVTEHNHKYYNNIIANGDECFGDGGVGEATANNLEFYNNTCYASSTGSNPALQFPTWDSSSGGKFYNNIIYTAGRSFQTRTTGREFAQADHNVYYSGFEAVIGVWTGYDVYSSLSAWQASGELYANYDAGCGSNQNPGCGSLVADPEFVTATGARDTIAEFALDAESPCLGAGRSGVDIGADVSIVGVNKPDDETPATTATIQRATGGAAFQRSANGAAFE